MPANIEVIEEAWCRELIERNDLFRRRGPRRMIRGICATPTPNAYGKVCHPEGARYVLPAPLLLEHRWAQPIGRVTELNRTPHGVTFAARLADSLPWSESV